MAKILIVDDQSIILLTLERILRVHNHEVSKSTNAFDALERLNKENFDLLITDAVMPGRTGFDLVSSLRKSPQFAKLPALMLTGRRGKKDVEKGIEAGVSDYLLKPIDPDLLIAKVEKLLIKNPFSKSSFPTVAVALSVHVEDLTTVTEVSEFGVKLSSNVPMTPGSQIKLNEKFYNVLGVNPFSLRIVECQEDRSKPGFFKLMASFQDLNQTNREAIAQWILARSSAKAA